MLSLIPLLFAEYPWWLHMEEVETLNKCTTSGKIIEVNIASDYDDNCDIVSLIIEGEGEFRLTTYSVPININPKVSTFCLNNIRLGVDYFYGFGKNLSSLPKIGDNINFLVDENTYKIVSSNRISNGKYEIVYGEYTSTGNFEICEPNVGEDTEFQKKLRKAHTYLNELYDKKPKLVKSLLEPLKQATLSDKLDIQIRNLALSLWKIVYNL